MAGRRRSDHPAARVTVGIDDADLVALTTIESVDTLELEPGGPVGASFDTTSVRGVTVGD